MPEMKPIVLSLELPGNMEKSWKWLTEEELQKKWMTGLVSLKRNDGGTAYEAGAAWTMVMLERGKQRTFHATTPEVDQPRRFTLSIDAADLAKGGKIEVEYKLTPEGDKTRLDYHSRLVAERFSIFLKIMSPLIIMMITKNTRKLFRNLVAEMARG